MRNEYVKYRKQTSYGQEVDLLDLADGILLQWYSGFDAALCKHSSDPKACTCDNEPPEDYPNTLNSTRDAGGLLSSYWQTYVNVGGNMFPSTFPVRCQACGKNVILPDGSRGDLPCAPEVEEWYVPSENRSYDGANPESVMKEHLAGMVKYVDATNDVPKWWVKGIEIDSKCPRAIDCPDFRYKGEEPYSRQLNLLKSLSTVVDLAKVSIGFETLGIDVQVQMMSWQDKALPYTTEPVTAHQNPPTPYKDFKFYDTCSVNITLDSFKKTAQMGTSLARCAMPLLSQQWGPKFNASEVLGLEGAVQKEFGKTMAGVGFFTLDGVLSQKTGHTRRFWHAELQKLNETYQLPCSGDACGSEGDPPSYKPDPSAPIYKCDWSAPYPSPPVCKVASDGYMSHDDCTKSCHRSQLFV